MCIIISLYLNMIFPWMVSGHTLELLDVQNDNMTKTSKRTNNTVHILFILNIFISLLHVYTYTINAILNVSFIATM